MDLARERGGVHDVRGEPIGVVLDNLVVEFDDPDKSHLEALRGWHASGSEPWQVGLAGRVKTDGYRLTEAYPHELCTERRRHELVRSARISNSSLERMDAVLVEVEPRLAAREIDLVGD